MIILLLLLLPIIISAQVVNITTLYSASDIRNDLIPNIIAYTLFSKGILPDKIKYYIPPVINVKSKQDFQDFLTRVEVAEVQYFIGYCYYADFEFAKTKNKTILCIDNFIPNPCNDNSIFLFDGTETISKGIYSIMLCSLILPGWFEWF